MGLVDNRPGNCWDPDGEPCGFRGRIYEIQTAGCWDSDRELWRDR